MRRIAAIDIGTNSIKITVAESNAAAGLTPLLDLVEITRLGKGVDSARGLSEEAINKTLDALRRFVDEARALGVDAIRAVGTSALRDAINGHVFLDHAAKIIGSDVEVLRGEREAQLTYLAAVSDASLFDNPENAILAFDVGGGSTELILGRMDEIIGAKSLDLGAVRLTERLLRDESPTEASRTAAASHIDQMLDGIMDYSAPLVVGIGGTAATVAALLNPKTAHLQGQVVSRTEIGSELEHLASMSLAERQAIPGLDPLRADVIVAGALIIERILNKFAAHSYKLSLRGVRYGLLLDMAREAA